ncbi:hypothetical protein OUZ56_021703 [Daphnia magna]|uniref:Uncharacterized protein n=1 Tax=Daphnia magna TaxID=35525 RepID=A0ABR0AU98_9CRUS|nr:hypothetical protein OUZ56_021703 [Daphnia magna]
MGRNDTPGRETQLGLVLGPAKLRQMAKKALLNKKVALIKPQPPLDQIDTLGFPKYSWNEETIKSHPEFFQKII